MESNMGTTPGTPDATTASTPGTMKDKATQKAQNLVERAQSQASSKINEAKTGAAQTLNTLASTLHQSGSQLREQQNMAGEYLDKAADGIERVATYLQNADAGEVVDNLQSFARRRPELFVASAFAVGLIAARFLKSSGRSTPLLPAHAGPSVGMSDREVPTSVSYERPTVPMERVESDL